MTKFVKQYLHCMNSKAGEKIPRPLGETVDGRRPGGVLHLTTCTSETTVPRARINI